MANPSHAIDLHGLANAPGHGAAKEALMKEGLWDEYGGLKPKEFRVRVEYSVRHDDSEVVTLDARCEQEAIEKACDKVQSGIEYDIEIEDAEVLE